MALALVWLGASSARADNTMGYRLLSAEEAASLPHNRGALGMDVDRAQVITDAGMTFEIIRVKSVRQGSAGARAGFRPGDDLIALNGRVFPSLAAFGAFVGSLPPGSEVQVDYIPAGQGPGQAQRISLAVGAAGHAVSASPAPATGSGMGLGTKLAIGAGAAALLGCYEMGCFSHRAQAAPRPAQ